MYIYAIFFRRKKPINIKKIVLNLCIYILRYLYTLILKKIYLSNFA